MRESWNNLSWRGRTVAVLLPVSAAVSIGWSLWEKFAGKNEHAIGAGAFHDTLADEGVAENTAQKLTYILTAAGPVLVGGAASLLTIFCCRGKKVQQAPSEIFSDPENPSLPGTEEFKIAEIETFAKTQKDQHARELAKGVNVKRIDLAEQGVPVPEQVRVQGQAGMAGAVADGQGLKTMKTPGEPMSANDFPDSPNEDGVDNEPNAESVQLHVLDRQKPVLGAHSAAALASSSAGSSNSRVQ